jgi:hypothetical protein
VLAGVGGAVASEIGQHFKAASPIANSTTITMVGDSVGYIIADASYPEDAIVNGLVHLIDSRK